MSLAMGRQTFCGVKVKVYSYQSCNRQLGLRGPLHKESDPHKNEEDEQASAPMLRPNEHLRSQTPFPKPYPSATKILNCSTPNPKP